MKHHTHFHIMALALTLATGVNGAEIKIAGTGQNRCYNNTRAIPCPAPGQAFFGQDAQYRGNTPAYRDNGDGTVTDLNTGLTWSREVSPRKLGLQEAQRLAKAMTLGGHNDWRVPNIKELYSLIDFRGYTGFERRGDSAEVPANAIPFINTDYFDFRYGAAEERYIDAQWLSSTRYASTTMGGMETLFGVNFADGRIKGYGYKRPGDNWAHKHFYVRYVRGNPYGQNRFAENGDGTITDQATGLTWAQMDSGKGMDWEQALAYAASLKLAGYGDWRLPTAKELQYIVDYSRSPDTTGSAAIDPRFQCSEILNEKGEKDYPAYWTSTTHLDGPHPGTQAVYIAFGRAMGRIRGRIMDVHGAGAQRSDPKTGKAEIGRGPQGDAIRIENHVRVVRGGATLVTNPVAEIDHDAYPYNVQHPLNHTQSDERKVRTLTEPRNPPTSRPDRMTPEDFSRHFIQRLDRNGDGQVSRKEFDGPPERFDYHDRDGDGYLSEDEAPRRPPPGAPPR